MTHKELLSNISYIMNEFWVRINTNDSELLNAGDALSALRAVVELHKPVINALPDETCLACQDLYPCSTIQAIEKELNA